MNTNTTFTFLKAGLYTSRNLNILIFKNEVVAHKIGICFYWGNTKASSLQFECTRLSVLHKSSVNYIPCGSSFMSLDDYYDAGENSEIRMIKVLSKNGVGWVNVDNVFLIESIEMVK